GPPDVHCRRSGENRIAMAPESMVQAAWTHPHHPHLQAPILARSGNARGIYDFGRERVAVRGVRPPVRTADVATVRRHKVLVVGRFDRRLVDNTWWTRLPQEDFSQVLGLSSESKCEDRGSPCMRDILDRKDGSPAKIVIPAGTMGGLQIY